MTFCNQNWLSFGHPVEDDEEDDDNGSGIPELVTPVPAKPVYPPTVWGDSKPAPTFSLNEEDA